ncbi:hypothetical protein GDO81_014755 [Engystomops pustulosus]|uniref:Uncharacterized protein n=1 Tax=Engystomops pustulosus TaxID=76066 RepID=A0AAV7AES7_ENGPU|nr:hypothetical protein GDO81_014755 [Engystomops pustulosus]
MDHNEDIDKQERSPGSNSGSSVYPNYYYIVALLLCYLLHMVPHQGLQDPLVFGSDQECENKEAERKSTPQIVLFFYLDWSQ